MKLLLLLISFFFPPLLHGQEEAERYRYAYFSGGDFWPVKADLESIPGVVDAVAGYAGGHLPNPAHEQVLSGESGHRLAVRITYDYNLLSYEQLLDAFIRLVDPLDGGGSFSNRGPAYGTALYFTDDNQLEVIGILLKNLSELPFFQGKRLFVAVERFRGFFPAAEAYQVFAKKDEARYLYERSGRDEFIQRVWKTVPASFLTVDGRKVFESPFFTQMPFMKAFRDYQKPSLEALRKVLSPLAFRVTQEAATEPPFREGNFYEETRRGLYVDIVSGEPLFSSADKYQSGSGWPSFLRPIHSDMIVESLDTSFFMERVRLSSRYAGSHLGHLFFDGPKGRRYSVNGAALRFIPYEDLDRLGYGGLKNNI